ncbi:FCD domain-containing protein [Phaeobacter marinintestinus]|uniref:FCD domain-containing protein n=1 Tax=Falsiphaeobacter marinintestinus TaxID=1492905 RepID=UPI0011B48CC9|nr:FCD domain-containing protein [Phaeobacter marinintestinus]
MTLANKAYDCIRLDIIKGVLAPETALRLADLRDRYGMGFSPLREALNRLQSERFVDVADLKGFRVAPWSLDEMNDAISTRIEIETKALKAAIQQGDDAWESGIVSALHGLNKQADRLSVGGDFWELEARHYQFHRALISACGSEWKLRFFDQLYGATERYRIPALLNQTSGPNRDIKKEHSALAEAVLDRDARGACSKLQAHYKSTADWITRQMKDPDAQVSLS